MLRPQQGQGDTRGRAGALHVAERRRPHTTDANPTHFAQEGRRINGKRDFVIRVVAQWADFNGNNLSFFYSLQCDVRIQSMESRFDIIKAVKKSYADYPAERMAAC